MLAGVLAASAARADEPLTDLDCSVNPKLLDSHFTRYGFEPLKTVLRQEQWVVFRMPEGLKDTQQTGLYSYVVLSGDFQVEAYFGLYEVPVPTAGYGMSVGIAIDTNEEEGMIALQRNFHKDRGGTGFAIVERKLKEGKDGKKEKDYPTSMHPARGQKGRLVLRREKEEVVCLAADDQGELRSCAASSTRTRPCARFGSTPTRAAPPRHWTAGSAA
jgi:hypothetical protein